MTGNITETVYAIHSLCRENCLTLSVAESCTGGYLSHCLTLIPGASTIFEAGIVCYSIRAKENILGVPREVIERHGAVSEETALEMARRVISLTGSGCSAAVTGNLGPTSMEGKERGLVCIAACVGQETSVQSVLLPGSRDENREAAAVSALSMLLGLLRCSYPKAL